MSFIEIENLSFEYSSYDEEKNAKVKHKAIDNLSLCIEKGKFIAILGHNGSGKSTLAKHFTGILKGSDGNVLINGKSTYDENNIWDIRKTVGMVFQNPDNQLVASMIEDDVAFGAENLGLERELIEKRVQNALNAVGMQNFRKSQTSNLSGGQKQRIAIAGILAMEPDCIVLDEPTSMLDPKGRKEVLKTLKKLNREKGITIILITHYMDEVIEADRLIILEKGKIALDNTPLEVFKNVDLIKSLKLDVPEPMEISYNLNKSGFNLPLKYLKIEPFSKELLKIGFNIKNSDYTSLAHKECENEEILKLENINYTYLKGTVFEKTALENINLTIKSGSFTGIIGHTGSGKSTLIQIFNGLLKPNTGNVYFNRKSIFENKEKIKTIRQQIGVVFQYPEYQLFEETVLKDVAFAPKNMGLSKEEAEKRAKDALNTVGLCEKYYNKSPFDLSGGEKRRVAIAGILAMKPNILVFDELTAGLDPFGRNKILKEIEKMHKTLNITIILISHSMEDIAKCCENVIVLNKGQIFLKGNLKKVFENGDTLENIGLDIPNSNRLMLCLNKSVTQIPKDIFTLKECTNFLEKNLKKPL